MVIRIDPSKTPEANLYDLISKSNNGLTVGPDTVVLGTPTILSTPVGNRDTEIPLTAVNNKGFSGTSKIRYNRLSLNESVKSAPTAFVLTVTDTFETLKAKIIAAYGLIASEVVFNNGTDWALPSGSGATGILSMAPKPGSLMYNGSAINLTISRPSVTGSNTYDQFAAYINNYIGGTATYPHVVIADQYATAKVRKFQHGIIANQPMSGSPYRGWVSCDTPVSRVLQHLLPNQPAEQTYFSGGWLFVMSVSAAATRQGLPAVTRNGYTSNAITGNVQAVQINELLYWDPVAKLGMRWTNPWQEGTGPVPIGLVSGEAVFDTPGTYQWVVPDNVFSVSAVTVGAGGAAVARAGNGGGLGYKNNIPVTPGEVITVQVGISDPRSTAANNYGDSYFKSKSVVAGLGGLTGTATNNAYAGYAGDGGGQGGLASIYGGGGAAGYLGIGGSSATNNTTGTAGQGGGGGAGGEATNYDFGGAGGGVGRNGQGPDGQAGGWSSAGGGQGGSNGQAGAGGDTPGAVGGKCGGGAGASIQTRNKPVLGGPGGVRVVWGDNRSFPSNRVLPDNSSTITTY